MDSEYPLEFDGGWLPPEGRTQEQRLLNDEMMEQAQDFGVVGSTLEKPPERVIFAEMQKKQLGKLIPRIRQITGSCLPGDAMVRMADGTEKLISDVRVGDSVLSHRKKVRKVLGVSEHSTEECMLQFSIAGRNDFWCTEGHVLPVLAVCGRGTVEWKKAGDIVKGDRLFSPILGTGEVADGDSITREYGANCRVNLVESLGVPDELVYDIEVEEDHSFIADGISVHNCVGAGAAQAYADSALGDVVHRGDREEVKLCYPWATYGVGREIGGMRGTGSGSFGGAQAKAVRPSTFGMLEIDDSRLPQPRYIHDGTWVEWSKSTELEWSHPRAWPIPRSELSTTASKYGMHTITQIKSTDEWVQLLAQGYGVTLASMFGTRPRVEKGVLVGRWNASWAHQMSSAGYWLHPELGLLFLINNQWGPSAHGKCPVLSPIGVLGSFWMPEKDAAKVVRTGEVIGHSSTGGFNLRTIDWSNFFTTA